MQTFRRGGITYQPNLEDFEKTLITTLQPVRPDPKFVDRLHRRLSEVPTIVFEPQTGAVSLLLIGLGLLTGVVVLMVGGRALEFLKSALSSRS